MWGQIWPLHGPFLHGIDILMICKLGHMTCQESLSFKWVNVFWWSLPGSKFYGKFRIWTKFCFLWIRICSGSNICSGSLNSHNNCTNLHSSPGKGHNIIFWRTIDWLWHVIPDLDINIPINSMKTDQILCYHIHKTKA